MSFSVRKHRPAVLAAAALVGASLVTPSRDARADDVAPTGKGIVGGGLLGAEVVTITESLVGVRSGWAYLLGGVLGAGAGAVGGYFVEQNVTDGQVPMYMLAGGLALVIPAVVLSLDATRYRPEEGLTEDKAPTGPAAEPGVPGGSISGTVQGGASVGPAPTPAPAATPAPAPTPPPPPPPQSLFDVHQGTFRLGVPVPSIVPMFSALEARQYGLTRNDAELKMPVVHVSF
jgi:hypothetical protein